MSVAVNVLVQIPLCSEGSGQLPALVISDEQPLKGIARVQSEVTPKRKEVPVIIIDIINAISQEI